MVGFGFGFILMALETGLKMGGLASTNKQMCPALDEELPTPTSPYYAARLLEVIYALKVENKWLRQSKNNLKYVKKHQRRLST